MKQDVQTDLQRPSPNFFEGLAVVGPFPGIHPDAERPTAPAFYSQPPTVTAPGAYSVGG